MHEIFCAKEFSIIFAACLQEARMAELVDALDSKSSNSNVVWVRFPLRVQKKSLTIYKLRTFSFYREWIGNESCLKASDLFYFEE